MLLTLLSNQQTATVTLYPPLVANTSQFYAAAVTPGTVTLQPTLLVNSNTFYSAAVTPGAVTLLPSLYTNSNTFYSCVVSVGGKALVQTARLDNVSVFYSPTITAMLPPAGNQDMFVEIRSFTERRRF